MVPSVPSTSSRDAQLIVAEAGIPSEQHLFGMFQRDVHGVGHFAAVLPQVDAAGHGDALRNLQAHHLVPEGQLVAHVLVDVAAGIVPEKAPVDVAVGVESDARPLHPGTISR